MIRIVLLFLLLNSTVFASNADFSVNLQNTSLQDAVRLLAKFLGINVMISPLVQGKAAMSLQRAASEDVFNLLLITHGLAKMRMGNVWLIAPQDELLKRKQDELKWQELTEETEKIHGECLQIRYAKAEVLARMLANEHGNLLSKRGLTRFDVRTNRLCIQDIAQRLLSIKKLVLHLDVPVKQISIAARLVSIDSDYESELGITFPVGKATETSGYSLLAAKLADGSLLDVKLAALEKAGHAELISSPSLFTANQQLASIEAGEEMPYQEVSESGGTAVVFKKAVLALKVIPQILPSQNILLRLQINQDRPNKRMVQGMPTINTRRMITNVLAKSGQTIVLGGIYEEDRETGESGVPYLNRIPVLGKLFSQKDIRHKKRELLIFVTPNIIG